MKSRVYHLGEMRFTVVAKPSQYFVDFEVFEIQGIDQAGMPVFRNLDINVYPTAEQLSEGEELFLHGSVKWDGCSNWYFDSQDQVMIHGCTRECLMNIGIVMAFCWELTAELCPEWAGD